MSDLRGLTPRFAPGARLVLRDDGSGVLSAPPTFVEIAADQVALVSLLLEGRAVDDVLSEHYRAHRFVPFQALADLLATLRREGVLQNAPVELDAAGIQAPTPSRWARRGVLLPMAFGRAAVVGLGLLAALALTALVVWPSEPMRMGPGFRLLATRSALQALLGLVVGASLALALRSVLMGFVGALFGAQPFSLWAGLHRFVPALLVQTDAIRTLPRARRFVALLAGVAGPWLVVLVLRAGSPLGALSAPALLGAGAVGFVDLCPFAPTALGQLLATLAGNVDLRDHARSYLSRRLLSRVTTKGLFDGERVMVLSSTLSIVWCIVALDAALWLLGTEGAGLVASALTASGAEAWLWALLCVALAGSLLVALTLLGRMVVFALASVFPERVRRPGATSAAAGTDVDAIPLFAGLSAPAREALAREVQREELPAGALVFRQGDPGDRFFSVVEGQVEIFVEEPSGLRRPVTVLQKGDCFGEMALIEQAPRSAGARTLGRAVVLSLHQDAFSALSSQVGAGLTGRLRAIAAINRNDLFKRLTAERVGALASRLTMQGVAAGQAVVQEGALGDAMYLVDSGELEVLDRGGAAPVATLKAGDLFGEVAVLRAIPRTATVRAKVQSSLWVLSAEDFYHLLGKDLPWMSAMESHASRRLRG